VARASAADPAAQAAHLELIAEMTEAFADTRDVDATLRRALARITEHVGAEGGSLFLLDPERDQLVCNASTGPVDLTGLRLGAGEGIVGRTVRGNGCELVRDVRLDPSFQQKVDQQTGFTTRSILCASLSVGDRSLGAIELVNKLDADGLFDDRDRVLLRTLAAAAGLALQNARLTERLVEQERVRRELELAAEIQRNLLPARRPPPFPIFGVNVPARGVSGDFYAWLELPDGRIGFGLGDVSGKGMNAALLMAQTLSAYRCLARTTASPGELLARVNDEVCDTATRGMFVTMVVGELDPRTRRVRLANAGHEPPLLRRRDGSFETFPAEAPPVGIACDVLGGGPFPEVELELDGASLYLYTDGLTEGRLEGRPLGAEGVRELVAKHEALPPGERLDAIAGRVAGEAERDDITLLVVEPAPRAGAG
jgi:sigma-B regulation protein RsbU (phosphoserine phosphatase)